MTADNQAVDNQGVLATDTGTQTTEAPATEQPEKTLSEALYPPKEAAPEAPAETTEAKPESKEEGGKSEGEAAKAEGETKEGEAKEIDYEALKKPDENSYLNDKDVERIAAIAKEQGLSLENAQKILDMQNEKVNEYHNQLIKSVDEKSQRDYDELLKDPELGGANFDETKRLVNLVVNKFGGEEFRTGLIDSGLDNNPMVMRFLVKIASQFDSKDQFITSSMHTPPKEKSFAQRMYPTKN